MWDIAAVRESYKILSTLIEYINKKIEEEDKPTIFYMLAKDALLKDRVQAVKVLKENNALPHILDDTSPLIIAGQSQSWGCVKALIVEGVDLKAQTPIVNGKGGKTIHHIVAENGKTKIIKLLLDKGEKFEKRDAKGCTALHYAAFNSQIEVCEQLIDSNKQLVHLPNRNGLTPLHCAASIESSELCKILLSFGASACATTYLQETPIHLAALHNRVANLNQMLQVCVERDFEEQDSEGFTALHYAVSNGCKEASEWLLTKAKVNPNLCNKQQESPLHLAARLGQTDIAKVLLDNGIDVSLKNVEQLTAYEIATACDSYGVKKAISKRIALHSRR